MKPENGNVIHNLETHRFEIAVDGHIAMLEYVPRGNVIVFTHTYVPPAIEGRGLGSLLVEAGLTYARDNELRVKSFCWFVSKYIRLNPEYQDLLYKPTSRE